MPKRPRKTRNGRVLESTVLPALKESGFECTSQVNIGTRHGGGRHMVDVVAERDGRKILVSLKWQQVSGTAEQKVPFEVICLLEALKSGTFAKAYLVLGGPGWRLREFYVSGGLKRYLRHKKVEILTLESFIAQANSGRL